MPNPIGIKVISADQFEVMKNKITKVDSNGDGVIASKQSLSSVQHELYASVGGVILKDVLTFQYIYPQTKKSDFLYVDKEGKLVGRVYDKQVLNVDNSAYQVTKKAYDDIMAAPKDL
jgi:hypothetical protein